MHAELGAFPPRAVAGVSQCAVDPEIYLDLASGEDHANLLGQWRRRMQTLQANLASESCKGKRILQRIYLLGHANLASGEDHEIYLDPEFVRAVATTMRRLLGSCSGAARQEILFTGDADELRGDEDQEACATYRKAKKQGAGRKKRDAMSTTRRG